MQESGGDDPGGEGVGAVASGASATEGFASDQVCAPMTVHHLWEDKKGGQISVKALYIR